VEKPRKNTQGEIEMNKVILIGNIATDIDLKATPNGNYVARFNIAINERNGEATFIPVETWKKQAENVSQYCSKGSKVAVEDSIKNDKWQKEEQKRTFNKENAFSIQYLYSKGNQQQSQKQQQTQQHQTFEQAGEGLEITEDSLPF